MKVFLPFVFVVGGLGTNRRTVIARSRLKIEVGV